MTQTGWFGFILGILLSIAGAMTFNYGGPIATWLALVIAGICAIIASPLAVYAARWTDPKP